MLTNVKAGGIRCAEILCIENKTGVWGRVPTRRRPMGVILRRFYSFFEKSTYFLGVVWSKFCVFKRLNKVLMRPQGFCPGIRAHLSLLATSLGAKAKTVHLLSLLSI